VTPSPAQADQTLAAGPLYLSPQLPCKKPDSAPSPGGRMLAASPFLHTSASPAGDAPVPMHTTPSPLPLAPTINWAGDGRGSLSPGCVPTPSNGHIMILGYAGFGGCLTLGCVIMGACLRLCGGMDETFAPSPSPSDELYVSPAASASPFSPSSSTAPSSASTNSSTPLYSSKQGTRPREPGLGTWVGQRPGAITFSYSFTSPGAAPQQPTHESPPPPPRPACPSPPRTDEVTVVSTPLPHPAPRPPPKPVEAIHAESLMPRYETIHSCLRWAMGRGVNTVSIPLGMAGQGLGVNSVSFLSLAVGYGDDGSVSVACGSVPPPAPAPAPAPAAAVHQSPVEGDQGPRKQHCQCKRSKCLKM
jgi:hypothetical protein